MIEQPLLWNLVLNRMDVLFLILIPLDCKHNHYYLYDFFCVFSCLSDVVDHFPRNYRWKLAYGCNSAYITFMFYIYFICLMFLGVSSLYWQDSRYTGNMGKDSGGMTCSKWYGPSPHNSYMVYTLTTRLLAARYPCICLLISTVPFKINKLKLKFGDNFSRQHV